MENVIIVNQEELETAKKSIAEDGVKKLHVLADFDRTLTKAFVNGEEIPSIISILRDGNCLTSDYVRKARALYNKYHPIEVDLKIPLKEKKKAMREWWTTHFDLLVKSGLNKKDLTAVADSEKIRFREGFSDFADFLRDKKIPLFIMSASGLGADIISIYLKKSGKLYDNIYIISNSFSWDENGKAIGVKEPIIHGMNKDETAIQDFPAFEAIENRKNVLLIGDRLSDVGMVKGFDYDNLIKIGFLNENIEENLEYYKQNYDVVILNDSPLDYINGLLGEIVK